jgi:tRNA (cmo5U34)-methyltransferase
MHRHEIVALYDQQHAANYDQQGAKLAPLREALLTLAAAQLADLRADARVLCVGAGTGTELVYFAERHPGWTFTAVEPSAAMLDVCRANATAAGIAERCTFHEGYLESLPASDPFDVATSLLVSQFILDRTERTNFFRQIAARLRPGGWLVNADLAADQNGAEYEALSELWWHVMRPANAPREGLDKMRAAYQRDVAVIPPEEVAGIIAAAGFERPVQVFQAGLLCGWLGRKL